MASPSIILAGPEHAGVVALMLRDFNVEFDSVCPPQAELKQRTEELLAQGAVRALLAGEAPDGLSLLSFRPSVWADGPVATLDELYVRPEMRGRGIGRALLKATLGVARQAGCAWIELGTGETDAAARGLYESFGFTNVEDSRDRPRMLYYELEL